MKNFLVRSVAIVVAVILFAGAFYTCCIAGYMCLLSSDVAEAELKAASGDPHMRRAADAIYEEVSKAREELYFGGGYKSWFSYQLPKALQIIAVLVSIALMLFEGWAVAVIYESYKLRKERARMKREKYRKQRELIAQAQYYPMTAQKPRTRR
ncbi:MAG: hypothetical protein IKL68_04225 [Clostridia bacterium]|nr:hypothetical protein [Clostridia bacterium]